MSNDKTKEKSTASTEDIIKRLASENLKKGSVDSSAGESRNLISNPDIRLKGGENALQMSPEVLEKTMAKNQSIGELAGKAWTGFAYNAASSFVSNFGSFDPNLTYNMMLGQEQEYSNTFLDFAHKLQQKGQEPLNRIYRKDPNKIIDFTDPAYWAEQHVQAGTSFGMFAASTLETLAMSAILPGGGTAMAIGKNTAKGVVQMQKAKKYKQFLSQTLNYLKKAPTQALTFGVVNRHAESVMEASETFRSLQQEFLDKGYDEEVAKKYAADGAARVYRLNMPLFLIDAAQWTLLTRLSPFKGSSTFIDDMLNKIKNPVLRGATALGMNMASEGMEEGYQHIAQEEGSHFATAKLLKEQEGIDIEGSFKDRFGNYLQDPHFWNAVVAGAYGSLLLAPIGGAGGYINQKRLQSSQKEFNEKMLWANQQKQLQNLSKSFELEEQGKLAESLVLRQHATNAEALNALEWDATTGKESSWIAYENKYTELAKLAKQDDNTIDEAMQKMGFTNENGITREARIEMIKGKEEFFTQILADGKMTKDIFEKTSKELGKFGKRGLVTTITAQKLQAAQIKQKIESLKDEAKSFTEKIEGLTSVGKIQFNVEAAKKARSESLAQLKKSLADGKLSEKEKVGVTSKIQQLESIDTEEVQEAVFNSAIAENNLKDNRTTAQKTQDAKVIKETLSQHKNNPVAQQKFFEDRLEEVEQLISTSTTDLALKTNYRQAAVEAIKLAENVEELKEVGDELVKDGQMNIALKNRIEEKAVEINNKKLKTPEDKTVRDALNERHEVHAEIAENEKLTEGASGIAIIVEEALEQIKPVETPKKEEVKSSRKLTQPVIVEEDWDDLFPGSNFSVKHDKIANDFVNFSEKHDFLNEEQVDNIAKILKVFVETGILPENFNIKQAMEKILPVMGVPMEMATPYAIGIAMAMESMNLKIRRPEVYGEIKKITTPPITEAKADAIAIEEANVELVQNEKEDVTKAKEETTEEVHYRAEPTFSYLSRRYEVIKEQDENGETVERIVEVIDELNQSQIVDYKHLLNPNTNFYESEFVIYIPENAQDLPVSVKTKTGTNIKGLTKPFKEFGFEEGSQEWVDNIPIFVGMKNPETGEVIPVAYLHQQNWVTKENLFAEKFDDGTLSETYDEVDKVNITKQAQEQNRKVRQAAIDGKGLAVNIEISQVSNGKNFTIAKDAPLRPLKEASLNQAMPIMINKGNIIGLPDGITKDAVKGMAELLDELGTKVIIAEIRHTGTGAYGDKEYTVYKVLPGKFKADTELLNNMKHSVVNAVKIYLYKDYIKGKKKVPKGDAAFAKEIENLKKVNEEMSDDSRVWYELSTSDSLLEYLSNFFIQSDNFGGLKTHNSATIKQEINKSFKESHGGIPFVKVTKQGQVVMGYVGQEDSYVLLDPKNVDTNIVEEQIEKFLNAVDKSVLNEETSPIIPKNALFYDRDFPISFIVPNEQGGLSRVDTETGYRDFLYENSMYTNVLTENLGTEENPIYVTRFQKVFSFTLAEEQKKSKVIQDSKHINEQTIKEKEKLVENLPTPEIVDKSVEDVLLENILAEEMLPEETLKTETAEKETTEEIISEKSLEEKELLSIAKKFTKFLTEQPFTDNNDNITMRGYLELIPIEYQLKIISYIYNQLIAQIDLQNVQQTNLTNLKNNIRKIVDSQILAHETSYLKILNALEQIENPSEEVTKSIEDLKRFQNYFETIKDEDNYAKLEKQALIEFKNKTNLTETASNINEDGEVLEDVLEESNRQSETLLEQSSLTKVWKPTQEASIFLSGIPKLDAQGNLIRTIFELPEYYDSKEILEKVRALSTLYLTEPTIDGFIKNLENVLANNPEYNWLQSFIDRFKVADKKTQTVLVVNLVKDVVIMEFISYNYNSKTKEWSSSVWNTNANDIARLVQDSWEQQFLVTDLINFNGGVATYNKVAIKSVLNKIANLKVTVTNKAKDIVEASKEQSSIVEEIVNKKGFTNIIIPDGVRGVSLINLRQKGALINIAGKTYEVTSAKGVRVSLELSEGIKKGGSVISDLRELFISVGIDLKDSTINHLIQNGLTNTKGVTVNLQGLFARNGLFHNLEVSLNKLAQSREDVEVDLDADTFPLSSSGISNLAKLDAKYNLAKLSQSFRDNKKTISTYKDNNLFTQKTIELKNVNGAKRALYKKNAFSKHSLWLKFLDGTGAENALMRDVFQASYLGLTSLKEIGKKAYRDNSLHKLDNSDLEFIYLSAFTDLKAGNLVEGHKINGVETRLARVFSFPMADKDLIFMVKTLVLNIKNQHLEDNFSENLQKILYSQIALPEIERMINHVKNGEKTNIEGYDKGAMLAIMYPVLNAAIIEHQGEKFTLQNFVRKFSSELENPYSEASKLLENTLTPKIVDVIKNKIDEKIKVWEDSGIIYEETSTTTVNGEEVETVTLKTKIDSKYLKSLGEDLTLEDRIRLTAANFVINQHIASANQMMLFSGDIAQYTKLDPNAKESLQQLEDVNLSEEERIHHSEVISRAIDDNFGKRSAMLLAPRSHTEDTVNSKYLQIFLADYEGVSNILPYITKKLDGVAITKEKIIEYQKAVSSGNIAKVKEILSEYPNSKNYFKINATDAQEYTTLREHLYNLEKRGELGNLTTQDVLEKVDEIMQELRSGTKIENLSSEHKKLMDFILQPMKNVYTGEIWDEQNNLLRSMYIKSSDFPLVPWLTMGTPLDSLRVAMENLETKSGMNVRASYESANKVGGISHKFNMFDSDGNIVKDIVTAENLEASSMVLERKYHGKQQNVPYKSDKKKYDEVSLGTQESKILMSLVADLDGFVYKGETIDGNSLVKKYNETFEKLYEIQYNALFDSLGVDTITGRITQPIKHFKALQKLVSEEATNRGWSLKDKEALTVVAKLGLTSSTGERVVIKLNLTDIEQIEKGKYDLSPFSAEIRKQLSPENFRNTLGNIVVNFEIPAWISGNKQNIESLLNSIVSNRVSKIKMPGASYVLGSSAGFTWSSMETLSEDVKAIVAEGVIYFDNYTGEDLKSSHTDENGVFHPAQVLMPSKIRDNRGKLLNLNDPKYYTIINGKRFIKKEMFSQEVWERVSFRIPTSKLSSSSIIEVVGILPPSVGDLIITPKDFTVQKGLDFDVDKEYTYHKYTWIDENGVVQPLSKKYEDLDVNDLTEDELRKTRRDFQKLLNLFAQNNEILDEINQLTNLGAAEYIELWGLDAKQDKIYEIFEKFEAKYPGKNIDEIFAEFKRRLEYQEDMSKLLKNDVIDQHLAVLKHSDLQKEILEVLSIALAKKDAEYFQSLSSGKKGDYFTLLDATHQISKISNAASSKVGVGAYSLDVVFNGLLQQAYNKTKTEIYLREIFITEDGFPVWIPYTLNIGGMSSSGSISTTNTLDGFRSKAEVLSERQNLMLDDAKEGIAWRVNLNTMTMDADKALVFLGFDLLDGHSIAFSLFSQPIIKEYVKIMKRLGAATQDEYVADKMSTVVKELVFKFGGFDLYNSIDHKDFLLKVTHENFKNGITNPTNMEQLAFLKVFLELDAKGKSLRKIETSLNVDSKGVGISINEVLERKNKLLQILERDKAVEGVSTLFGSVRHIDTEERGAIEDLKKQGYYSVGTTLTKEGFDEVLVKPETAPAIATINGLKAAELLWLPHFAQSHTAYQAFKRLVLSEISSKITQEEEIEYNIALEEDLLEAYQKFHNSDTETGMFPEDVDNLRRTFIRDTVDTIALGTYLQKLKIGEQKELFEKNAFLKSLRFRTDKQGKVLIEFNSSARVNIDERVIHEAIAILYNSAIELPSYNGREYSTRELVKDLRTFAYLQGGIQEAVEFINFLPTELIAKTNYITHMNKLNIQLKGYSRANYADVFKTDVLVKQFFQHFPNRAAKITVKEIEENEANIEIDVETGELKPFKLNLKNLESFAFSGGPKYLTLYDSKSETKYALFEYNPEMAQYVKIPTYTSFGMSQYNKQRPLEENIDSINSVNELESLILKLRESKVNYVKNLNHVVLKDGEGNIPFNIVKNSISEDSNPFKIRNSPASVLNAKGILERVSNAENLSEFERDLAKLLSQALAGKPIEIIIFEDTVSIDGMHSKQTPTALTSLVGFNEAIFGYSEQEQARIILHEFIHATLVQELSKFLSVDGKWLLKTPPSNPIQVAIYQIGKLYQQYNESSQESLNTSKKRSVDSATLAVKNVHEFIAEIMTSQKFQKSLSEITVPKTEKSIMQKFSELVTKFLNALNRSLGFEVKKDSITVEAISNILTVLEGGLNTKKPTTTTQTPTQPVEKTEAELIYNLIGKTTVSENVVIVDNPNEFLSQQEKGEAVVAYKGAKQPQSFMNPFHVNTDKTTKENVIDFINFVLKSSIPQAVWIREQIQSGKFKSKPIYYGNTRANKNNEPSHATALDYLINKHVLGTQPTPIVTEETIEDFEDAMTDYLADENNIVISLSEKHTSIKEGVQELFDSNPELASIGTLLQYSQYLDTIFPDSKVKIGYHGSMSYDKIMEEGFDFNKAGENLGFINRMMSFFTFKGYTNNFENKGVVTALIDITNEYKAKFRDVTGNIEIIDVFEPEQIHILGSKQDIDGFKDFVNNNEVLTSFSMKHREITMQDRENMQIGVKNILKDVKDINVKMWAEDTLLDFINKDLENVINHPNNIFNEIFGDKNSIDYLEASKMFNDKHVIAKTVEQYSTLLKTYEVARNFDETWEEKAMEGLGVFHTLNDKMVISEDNFFLNSFIETGLYQSYSEAGATQEQLDKLIENGNKKVARVFAHETVHLLVSKKIHSDIEHYKETNEILPELSDLNDLFVYVERVAPHLKDAYGMTNLQEFVAEALTASSFKRALMKIPANTAVNTSKYPAINFFQQLLDALINYLSLSEITDFEKSVLKQIMIVSDKLAMDNFNEKLPTKINELLAINEATLEGVQNLENTGLINIMC